MTKKDIARKISTEGERHPNLIGKIDYAWAAVFRVDPKGER